MPTYVPTPSPYLVDYSDPTKTPITVQPASKDGPGQLQQHTSITLHGQNSLLYGEGVNENFVHLVENFANSTPPLQPIEGQLWLNNSSTYSAGFNETLSYKQGDHLFRVFRRKKDPLNPTNFISYWSTINPTIVDVDITNRLAFTAEPGHLWYDMDVSDDVDVLTGSSWTHPQLKVYDPDDGWVSIARNYVQLIGNQTLTGTWTVTDDITGQSDLLIQGNSIVQGNSSVNGNAAVTGTLTVTGATTLNGATTVTKLLTLASTTGSALNVTTGTSTFGTTTTFNGTVVTTNTMTVGGALTVNANSNFNSLVTLTASSPTTTALTIDGSTTTTGNISANQTGTFNALVVTTTANVGGHLTMTGASNEIRANTIDMRNHNIINLSDPTAAQHATTKAYTDNTFLARDASLGAGANAMSAVLVLNNVNQNASSSNAATVGYANTKVAKSGDTMTGNLSLTAGAYLDVAADSGTGGQVHLQFADATANHWNIYAGTSGSNDLVFSNPSGSVTFTTAGRVRSPVAAVNNDEFMRKGEVDTAVSNLSTSVTTTLGGYAKIWTQGTAPTFGAGNAKNNGDIWINTTNYYVSISANGIWRQVFPALWA